MAVANDMDGFQHGIVVARRLSLDDTFTRIQAGWGTQYDPQVVDALTVVLGRGAAAPVPPPARGPEREAHCTTLQAGMTLARDLVTPEGMLLIAADHSLQAHTIGRIQHFIAAGGLSDLKVYVKTEDPSIDEPG